MDTLLRTFVLLLTLRGTSSHSGLEVAVDCDADPELYEYFLSEGESLWYIPKQVSDLENHFTWYWSSSQDVLQVSTEETELVHADGPALFLLNATRGHSGCFMAREEGWNSSPIEHFLQVNVVPENSSLRLYSKMEFRGDLNCPSPVLDTCDQLNGTLSWYKDAVLLPDRVRDHVIVSGPEDEGLYDCVCTWTHQQHLYRSVGSKPVCLKQPNSPLEEVMILTPTEEEQLADAGAQLLLNCSVFCGTNVPQHNCKAWWRAEPSALTSKRYNRTKVWLHPKRADCNSPNGSKDTIATEVLTIARVSAKDFRQRFVCMGAGPYGDPVFFTVHLRRRQSMAPLVAAGTCVFLLSVLIAVMVKCFAVDLALLSRRFIPFRPKDSGVKVFDAYVVYQLQPQDKPTEEALARFVSQDLPHILEEQCGYRLFIHGRDDLPGEDRVELVEERIRKSRRLIVILTPGSGSEVSETYQQPEGYDWQVGLHQALVQRELSVIMVQLGSTRPDGYSHLPPALQHLCQRSAPIRWSLKPRAAHANSRFWKRVRYLMPAAPVRRHHLSAI